MKIIKSKKYQDREIMKSSEYDPQIWSAKLQNIQQVVHSGGDMYQAISQEFPDFSTEQIAQVKDYVLGALGRPVPSGQQQSQLI